MFFIKAKSLEAFSSDSSVKSVFYTSTQAQWEQINTDNFNEAIGKGGYGFIKTKFKQSFSNPIVYVTLNGDRINFSKYGQNPIVENGRTMLPLCAVVEAFGCAIEWDGAANTAGITM